MKVFLFELPAMIILKFEETTPKLSVEQNYIKSFDSTWNHVCWLWACDFSIQSSTMASNHLYTFIRPPKTKLIYFQIYLYKISFLEIALEQSYYLSSDIYSASETVELNYFPSKSHVFTQTWTLKRIVYYQMTILRITNQNFKRSS